MGINKVVERLENGAAQLILNLFIKFLNSFVKLTLLHVDMEVKDWASFVIAM